MKLGRNASRVKTLLLQIPIQLSEIKPERNFYEMQRNNKTDLEIFTHVTFKTNLQSLHACMLVHNTAS